MISYDVIACGEPLERSERPTPQPTGDQVLMRIEAAGVCHSDLHIWHGSYDLGHGKKLSMLDRGLKLPLTMGHEIAGEVIAGYADHVLISHSRYLVDIGDMPPVQAAPYACSGLTTYSGLRKFKPEVLRGEKVVIIGGGGLGLMATLLVKAMGGAGAIVIDPDESKHAAALEAGADAVFNPKQDGYIAEVKKAAGGAVWAVLDCVGSSQTVQAGIDMLTKGGHLVQIGLYGGHIDIPTPFMALRALTYQGIYVGNLRELQELMQLVRDKNLRPVPTTCMPLSKAFTALLALEKGQAVGRQILTPEAA